MIERLLVQRLVFIRRRRIYRLLGALLEARAYGR